MPDEIAQDLDPSPVEQAAIRSPDLALLTVGEMAQADKLSIQRGTPGKALMARAGRAVAETIMARWPRRRVVVFCGPGNNGGDGFVAARILKDIGWPVDVFSVLDDQSPLSDAEWARNYWGGPVSPIDVDVAFDLSDRPLIVDSLFGAGLSRPVDGAAAHALAATAGTGCPVIAVDVPSGVDGDSGQLRGTVVQADVTVTFFRPKPGHLLLPGKSACGDLVVADIGIEQTVLDDIEPSMARNGPSLWSHLLQPPTMVMQKYSRGAAVIYGGGTMAGAARLTAAAARRSGPGYVAAAVPQRVRSVYASDAPGLVLIDRDMWRDALVGGKFSAFCIGPGAGIGDEIAQAVSIALSSGLPGVIDADALMCFDGAPDVLFDMVRSEHVLTPHEGEFTRLFPDLSGSKLSRAQAAAARSGATIVLKGSDTVIAAPDGRAVINDNAPSSLATAGSGDVL
ncbi:MAG: NAD(P)H-hydrate epimerase, partial [Pseudomonadota bacterium]